MNTNDITALAEAVGVLANDDDHDDGLFPTTPAGWVKTITGACCGVGLFFTLPIIFIHIGTLIP